ncbi:MAG: hypothetical protein ISS57_05090 [Anaerolineales bacterium]|nr:hypothetical protein [Anaerolineales bacterium]
MVFLSLLWVVWLSGCGGFGSAAELPTLIPADHLPTVIGMTAEAMVTPSITPEGTPTTKPTDVLIPDDADEGTPSADAVQAAQADAADPLPTSESPIPAADIVIFNPGPLSKVVSPISLVAYVVPGADERARVELWGEDGRLMYRKIFNFTTPNPQGRVVTKFGFETPGVAEIGHLSIQTQDEYGRVMALASIDLILLSSGEADISMASDTLAPIVIQIPGDKELIQGDKILIEGLARTASEQPLLVELVAADGRILGSRLAGVIPTEKGEHHSFATEIPYQITAPTWVRIIVSERGGRLPGPVNISTVEVLLSP